MEGKNNNWDDYCTIMLGLTEVSLNDIEKTETVELSKHDIKAIIIDEKVITSSRNLQDEFIKNALYNIPKNLK